jgi:hypothetical protein
MIDKMSLKGSFDVVCWRVLVELVILRQWHVEQEPVFVHLIDIPLGMVFGMEDGPLYRHLDLVVLRLRAPRRA